MARTWNWLAVLSVVTLTVGCGPEGVVEPGRGGGRLGKADAPGSCQAADGTTYCGEQSADGCWCDAECDDYGDCCSDRVAVCEGGDDPAEPAADGLQFSSYEVLFTNPLCQQYDYDEPVPMVSGDGYVDGKPKNVYCKKSDADASGARPSSPQYRLVQWIEGLDQGDQLFLAYLSYSNRTVGTALCAAAERGVDVTFVLDKPTARSNELEDCGGTVLIRGHEGGIGYAHNKILMVNPNTAGPGDPDADYMRVVFSSGNMSSGAVLHHENWHFIEVKRASYFAEAHRCLMKAQLSDYHSSTKARYRNYLNDCRAQIDYAEESDISAYFVPNRDDSQAVTDRLIVAIQSAAQIDIGAHRFSYTTMIDELEDRLASDEDVQVRLVADDDLYWLRPWDGSPSQTVGNNMYFEANNVEKLYEAGDEGERFNVKYLETHHGLHLLHHNKFLIFQGMPGEPDTVLCGAANLTGTGFWDNFENIYVVTIPAVVKAFKQQYARFWDGQKASPSEQEPPRATAPWEMPAEDRSAN